MTRILNLIASVDPAHGGPIDGARRLAKIWSEEGHQVDFLTLDSDQAPYLAVDGARTFALGRTGAPAQDGERAQGLWRRFGFTPLAVPWLRAHVTAYDAVLVHALWNFSTVVARRVLVGARVPYFVFPHGALDPWFKRAYPLKTLAKTALWPLNEGPLMNGAAAVLFTTDEERRLAQGAHWPYRVRAEVVGFGSAEPPPASPGQLAAFRAAVPALGDRRFLLFLSRIHPKKGCDLLIAAFAQVAAAHPDLDLVFAGPDQTGWRAELAAGARARGLADRVHWTGIIDGAAKWGAYRACEAFVLPSHSENFGIVVAEALACGRPVLITDKVNLWREVAADDAGLVEPDTQPGIDRLLGRFLGLDADARRRMGESARACFERRFRITAAAAAILATMHRHGARA